MSMQGMYPTVIIVLVTLQKSHLENQFTYPGIPEDQNAALSFASRASHDIAGRVDIRDMVFVQNSSDVSSGSLNVSTSKTEGELSSTKEILDV